MTLRKPCEHGRYEPHKEFTMGYDYGLSCPGGAFLANDALVIEKVNGEWPDNAHLVARRWKASNDGTHYLFQRLLTDALTVRQKEGAE